MALLAIDIGTSSVKVILYDPDAARIITSAFREYPILQPVTGAAEQNPEDWWIATVAAVRQACAAGLAGQRVEGIGITGQMHGTVLLDAQDQPLRAAIIWADQRATNTCERMIEQIGSERFTRIAGTVPAVGFMGVTLTWLLEQDPASLDHAHTVLLPKDYVRLRMTGERATDVSDAASTALFDIAGRTWSTELLEQLGLPQHIFPQVLKSQALAGYLSSRAAAEFGLPVGIPVCAGCADQPAQALGNGLLDPGAASITIGTGGQVFQPLQAVQPLPTDPRLHVFNHAAPDRYYVLGAILAGGLSLRWLRNLLGMAQQPNAYEVLSAAAAQIPPGAGGLIFLPYLVGERTPHMDARARGAFIGLTMKHDTGHLARAVMEGVAFALCQTLQISQSLSGTAERIVLSGGAAESPVWRQLQADIYGVPLQRSLMKEQTSVGAALLAGVATGTFASLEDACSSAVQLGDWIEPDMVYHARYQALFERFVALYPRLRADFHYLSESSME